MIGLDDVTKSTMELARLWRAQPRIGVGTQLRGWVGAAPAPAALFAVYVTLATAEDRSPTVAGHRRHKLAYCFAQLQSLRLRTPFLVGPVALGAAGALCAKAVLTAGGPGALLATAIAAGLGACAGWALACRLDAPLQRRLRAVAEEFQALHDGVWSGPVVEVDDPKGLGELLSRTGVQEDAASEANGA